MIRSKKLLVVLIISSLVLSLVNLSETASAAKKIKLSKSKISLKVGKKASLKLRNVSKKKLKKIKWSISNKKIAKIKVEKKNKSIINIVAKKPGKANIIAKIKGKKFKCKIIVSKKNNNPKKSVNPTPTPKIIYAKIIYVEVTPKPTATPKASESPKPTNTPESSSLGNLTYQSDVTDEMTKASFWADRCKNPDDILISQEEIKETNKRILSEKNTNMIDLLNMKESYNATNVKNNLATALINEVKIGRVGDRNIYLDGQLVNDKDTFFQTIYDNIINAETQEDATVEYGLCTKASELKMAPVSGFIGWSATDTDEEFTDSRLNINEPLVIKAKTADGKYYWGYTTNCSGWISADCVAICDNKEEWQDMWTRSGDDILVVTTDSITLDPSEDKKEISELKLHFATVLPLVNKEDLPRGTWYKYVVYVPTRDDNGKFVRSMALIRMNNRDKKNISIGYLPFTTRNVLETAFSCLGYRYGWGGMLGLMDCSLYTRDIYKCFGFELPRNTSWQRAMPVQNIDLENLSDSEKAAAIETCLPGSLLMFPGHIMMYIGSLNGKQYIISDVGSLVETEQASSDLNTMKIFSVAINSLDVRRKTNGKTWLANMVWAGSPWLAGQAWTAKE